MSGGRDVRRAARGGLLLSAVAVAGGYASAFLSGPTPAVGPWLVALGTAGSLVSAMALGAARDGRLGPLGPVFLFVFVVLAGGFGAALLVGPPDGAGGASFVLGVPAGAALVLYGVGLLPLLVVPLAYAATFDRMTLDEADWQRIREVAGEDVRRGGEAGSGRGEDRRRPGGGP